MAFKISPRGVTCNPLRRTLAYPSAMAPQLPVPLARAFVRSAMKPVLHPRFPVAVQRRLLGAIALTLLPPAEVRVEPVTLGGRPAERLVPPAADPARVVLFLHGGGYALGTPRTHRALTGHLAADAGAAVVSLDYRLAPEHPHPAALEDAVAAYRELAATGARVALAGDSAGGGLALALALRLHEDGDPAPSALVLISPWADLDPDLLDDGVVDDPLLTAAWLRWCLEAYAGGDVANPAVSPARADLAALAALPPTLVQGSEQEILRPHVERLVERLEEAGAPVTFQLLTGVWHDVQLQAGLVAPATAAVARLGDFLRRHG